MQTDLDATDSETEWFVAGYGLTFATGLITAGRLGDRFGHRRTFSVGVSLFTITSLACAATASGGALITVRLLQGPGGGADQPPGLLDHGHQIHQRRSPHF
jgi:MFS family permease